MVMLETVQRLIGEMTHPIGSLYFNATDDTNPGTLLGFGTWEAFGAGRVLVGKNTSGTFATAGATGGAETHTLTEAQMPSHTHTAGGYTDVVGGSNYYVNVVGVNKYGSSNTGSAGSSQAHNNLQPYIVVYVWKRTA